MALHKQLCGISLMLVLQLKGSYPQLSDPHNVVLSVSPPGDVVKGRLQVTLTCNSNGSNSNPPIQTYILLKDNTEVSQGKIMTISNIQPSDSGRYSCQAKNNITTVTSPQVTLHVQYPPEMTFVFVNPPGGQVVEGSTVTLTCMSDANPPVDNYAWYINGGSSFSSTAPQLVKDNVSPADSGHYACQATNKHGSQMSPPHSIHVLPFQGNSHDDGATERIPTPPPIIDGPVRLVGGPHRCEGRVEIFYGNEWGTVCDDAWDLPSARVVCRNVGCGEATKAWKEATFGQGTGTILMDNVKCSGEEASLGECSHVSRDDHNCDHSEDAGVTCSES